VINIYYYAMFDPTAWTNSLSINGISDALNASFYGKSALFAIKKDKLILQCTGDIAYHILG
jgi:hypothetical protein